MVVFEHRMSKKKKRKISCRKSPGDIRTADENKAISSSVSCNEHKFFAKSNASFTRSSEPAGNTNNQVKFWKYLLSVYRIYTAQLLSTVVKLLLSLLHEISGYEFDSSKNESHTRMLQLVKLVYFMVEEI